MTTRSQRVEQIFHAALDLGPAQRLAYLDRACGDDEALRDEVERVFAADAAADRFLVSPIQRDAVPKDPLIGGRIGCYFVKRRIGSGGMGSVYEAIQENPERSVALKVLRLDRVDPDIVSRFSHEANILARLRHEGIAQIYEAGTHREGNVPIPFFAMEYLPDARSIVEFAAAKRLSIRERIELFCKVCEAVQYGHQRGIIHRDLKPANILVIEADGPADSANGAPLVQPKIIDFGIARVIAADAGMTMMETRTGMMLGTLHFMSPEQCSAEGDLDIRSDVYTLGVVLFELLTGNMPYDFTGVTPFDIPRLIRESSARTPSSYDRTLRGDLDTIILKTLEKDRALRYQTVAELHNDLRRFMGNEPIEARSHRGWYVLRKTLYRHRIPVAASAFVFVALLSAAIVSATYWRRSELDRAKLEETVAALEEQQAETATALERATESEQLARDRLGEMTDYARRKLSEMRETLGPEHDATLQSMYDLSMLLKRHGALAEVESIAREAIAIYEERFGREHQTTLRLMGGLATNLLEQGKLEEAEALFRECLDTRRRILGSDHADTLVSMNNFGRFLSRVKRPDEAEIILRECIEHRRRVLGVDNASTLSTMNNLANVSMDKGNFEQAEAMYREVLLKRRELLGPRHTKTMVSAHNLGELYRKFDRPEQAMPLLREAFESSSRTLPTGHWNTAQFESHFGRCLMALNRFDEAEKHLLQGYQGLADALGLAHRRTQSALNALNELYNQTGQTGRLKKADPP